MGIPGDFTGDQSLADSRSLCFTYEPLAEGVKILDNPEINLVKTSDKPEALLAVRLKTQIYR
jgi:predicted acyl esterase